MTDRPPIYCPLVTPFSDGAVDEGALASLVESLADAGLDGFVPCGTTGEFASLTDEEYRTVLEATADAAGGARVIAGTADTSVPGTLDRIDAAADAGCDAALITLPYFHTANDPAGNERFLRQVASGASLPVYLYNIPACTGAEIDPETVAAAAELDGVAGLKDSGGDFEYFLTVERETPDDFETYLGFDSLLVPGLHFGATGGINALSNAVPEVFVAVADAVAEGEFRRADRLAQEAVAPLFARCGEFGFAPAAKAAARSRDLLPTEEVRPPLVELDDGAREAIAEEVEAALDAI